jgi:sec-independent protein translocase protein TatB
MLDIGWSELLVIGVVALIVVGPKDLPKMFRALGQFTGKARRMASEFQSAMNAAADDSGVGDVAADLRKMANPKKYGLDKIREATDDLTKWEPDETTGDATRAFAEKRADARERIKAQADRLAEERRAREAAEAAPAPEPEPEPVGDPVAGTKP